MILNVTEDIRETTADASVDGLTVLYSAARIFTVEFDDGDDPWNRPQMALDDAITPAIWESHPFDDYMYINRKSVQVISPHLIKVLCHYTSTKDPLQEPPIIEWYFNTSNEPIDRDVAEAALVNSAGESFDPPLTMDHADLMVKVDRNEAAVDSANMLDYMNTVNEDLFCGCEPGQAKLIALTATEARAGDLYYWQVHYEIQFRRDGFKRRVLDEGFRIQTGTGDDGAPEYEICKDKDGNPVSQPVLLDGSGAKLADEAAPVFLEFETLRSVPFAGLDLENILLTT